jgi:hypothetical protein
VGPILTDRRVLMYRGEGFRIRHSGCRGHGRIPQHECRSHHVRFARSTNLPAADFVARHLAGTNGVTRLQRVESNQSDEISAMSLRLTANGSHWQWVSLAMVVIERKVDQNWDGKNHGYARMALMERIRVRVKRDRRRRVLLILFRIRLIRGIRGSLRSSSSHVDTSTLEPIFSSSIRRGAMSPMPCPK